MPFKLKTLSLNTALQRLLLCFLFRLDIFYIIPGIILLKLLKNFKIKLTISCITILTILKLNN